MHRLLVIERSATLRHALNKSLGSQEFLIAEAATFEVGLERLREQAGEYDGVIIGWPARTDPIADELFALLEDPSFKSLAVVILSEDADPAKLNWTTRRPSTAMLLWENFQEIVESLKKLLSDAPSERPPAPQLPPDPKGEVIRILFVDDSPTVRVSFRKLLSKQGYEVETASSVKEGMHLAERNRYDIAIIDYFMPDATGDELCRLLRSRSETAGITSSIITGTYLDKVIKDSLDAGAVECMFKNEAEELFLARVAAMSRSIQIKKSIDKERRRLEGILGSVGDGVYGVDTDGLITFMNPAARQVLGFGKEQDYAGKAPHTLFHYAFQDGTPNPPETCFLSRAYASGERLVNWQTVFWSVNQRPIPVECTVYPLHIEGRREGSVVAFRDVSERKLMEEELRWQANHDSLTKLLNRHYFESQLEQEVHRLKRNSDEISALLYIDLDQFKYINDTAGHAAGDRLLVQVGHLLQTRLRAADTLARLGGDEFAIILRNCQAQDLHAAADAFRNVLAEKPFSYAGKNYKVTTSIGVSRMDQYTATPGEALANADLACHIAKQKGRNQTHLYAPESDDRKRMDLELGWSARLHEALERDQFELVFHPIVGIRDLPPAAEGMDAETRWRQIQERAAGRPISYEVLLRLGGSDGEVVMPDAFLPTAERFNLMPQIDRWVLRKALSVIAEQQDRSNPVRLSVNLSGHTVVDRGLARDIKRMIADAGVDPRMLSFEITETCAITNIDAARRLIEDIRALGCQFALDDFGSGFSSFGHLKNLPVDTIKIDGLFTQGMLADPIDRAVVMSVVDIAHALGKRTVAEYVENEEILAQLSQCGVDYVQGNFIAHPQAGVGLAPIPVRLETGTWGG